MRLRRDSWLLQYSLLELNFPDGQHVLSSRRIVDFVSFIVIQAGSWWIQAGSRLDPGGSELDPGGSTLDPGGSRLDPGGSELDPGGSRLDPDGSRQDPLPPSL